jgi:hypothetical protein
MCNGVTAVSEQVSGADPAVLPACPGGRNPLQTANNQNRLFVPSIYHFLPAKALATAGAFIIYHFHQFPCLLSGRLPLSVKRIDNLSYYGL